MFKQYWHILYWLDQLVLFGWIVIYLFCVSVDVDYYLFIIIIVIIIIYCYLLLFIVIYCYLLLLHPLIFTAVKLMRGWYPVRTPNLL